MVLWVQMLLKLDRLHAMRCVISICRINSFGYVFSTPINTDTQIEQACTFFKLHSTSIDENEHDDPTNGSMYIFLCNAYRIDK